MAENYKISCTNCLMVLLRMFVIGTIGMDGQVPYSSGARFFT
jgi:hypothetical protein